MNEHVILLEVVLYFARYNMLEINKVIMAEWNRNFRGQARCLVSNLYLVINKKIKKLHNEGIQNLYS